MVSSSNSTRSERDGIAAGMDVGISDNEISLADRKQRPAHLVEFAEGEAIHVESNASQRFIRQVLQNRVAPGGIFAVFELTAVAGRKDLRPEIGNDDGQAVSQIKLIAMAAAVRSTR